jgi:hypothetical protein
MGEKAKLSALGDAANKATTCILDELPKTRLKCSRHCHHINPRDSWNYVKYMEAKRGVVKRVTMCNKAMLAQGRQVVQVVCCQPYFY